jgi:hypothetical protein
MCLFTTVEVPYDFPVELDGLPRAKEVGASLAKMSLMGFYKPSEEEKKQEMLAEVFKFRPGKVEKPEMSPRRPEANDEEWPDVEVRVSTKSKVQGNKPGLTASRSRMDPSLTRKNEDVPLHGTKLTRPIKSIPNASRPVLNQKSSAASSKPRALGERDSNAIVKKKVMNPALRDFENDQMGKIIKAKLQASEVQESESFLL